jgi:hypothetical protein
METAARMRKLRPLPATRHALIRERGAVCFCHVLLAQIHARRDGSPPND